MSTPSLVQLKRAVAIREQIDNLEAELKSLVGGAWVSSGKAAVGGAWVSSGLTDDRIGSRNDQGDELRLKRGRGRSSEVEKAPPVKTKRRKMSPEARARIVAAQKKRWAAFKKAKISR